MDIVGRYFYSGFLKINNLSKIPAAHFTRSCALLRKKVPTNIEYYYQDKNSYAVYAVSGGYVKEAALEAARIAIVRKTKNKTVYKIPATVPVTKKAEGSRMGKGKGKLDYYAAIVKPGKIILGFESENDLVAREAFKQATYKLPFRTRFRITPKHEKKVLTGSELLEVMAGKKLEKDYRTVKEEDDKIVEEFLSRDNLKF